MFYAKHLNSFSCCKRHKREALPRYSLQTIREPNPYLLRALFEPSERDGLQHYFAFYCQGAPVDPAANLRLRLWACASTSRELVPAKPNPKVQPSTVKGALIEQDIRTHVQQGLLLAYAEALDSSPGSVQVRWLKLGNISMSWWFDISDLDEDQKNVIELPPEGNYLILGHLAPERRTCC